MSVATFNNDMKSIYVSLDDREIYNDIRSQIDITVTELVSDPSLITATTAEGQTYTVIWGVSPNETRNVTYTMAQLHQSQTWVSVWAVGTPDLLYPTVTEGITAVKTASGKSGIWPYITIQVTNGSTYMDRIEVYASYTYNIYSTTPQSHTETNTQTLTVREYDSTSIGYYGRRSMYLIWPLGQSEEQTRALAAAYLARYKDPVARVTIVVEGKSVTLAQTLLGLKITDLVTVINTELGLNGDFYINSIDVEHSYNGLLTYTLVLEQQRLYETYTLFTLDTSELDGTHVLGY